MLDEMSQWAWRFHRDDKSWVLSPHVFVDRGRVMPDGEPPLVKERPYVRREDVEQMWKPLLS